MASKTLMPAPRAGGGHAARWHRRDWLAAAFIAVLCSALATSPALEPLRGLTLDTLTALRWHVFGLQHNPASSPAVVVAIDEATHEAPPFKGSPTVTWTREIGRVLTALVDGGAAVVGFDVIFPGSIEQSQIPFGDELVGARLRGFDREFLRALHAAASTGQLVLGELQQREPPIRPAPGQRIAVGQQRNIRALDAHSDADDVVRRMPLAFEADGVPVPTMAVELAARALRAAPQFGADGSVTLADWRIPAAVAGTMTLNFEGGADGIPTHSLADLHACAVKGDRDHFRRHFDGRVVLFGTLLDTEDRIVTSKRFATGPEHAGAPRCAGSTGAAPAALQRRSISGVYVHATAVNNLVRRDALAETGRAATAAWTVSLAAAAAAAALRFTPAAAAAGWLLLFAAYTAGAVFSFRQALAVPLVEPLLAGIAALAATGGWRFFVVDRAERLLRSSFELYLAPQLVERLLESERAPELGGEMREVSVFFSDIAGFSSFAENLSPQPLVTLMNHYLSEMTDLIEAAGGYVDKYIGDSIVAVFGAPLDDPDHARNAVLAALACQGRLQQMNRDGQVFQGLHIEHRIGIHSGPALVGNIGSRRRFNYTVMGDAVNLASRLEGANKYLGTSILVSETTVALGGEGLAWREIDAVLVQGRSQPVRVFEPLAEAGRAGADEKAWHAAYAEGLAAWRRRDFAAAAEAFARFAAVDAASARFEARARELATHPPGPDWEPINRLQGK